MPGSLEAQRLSVLSTGAARWRKVRVVPARDKGRQGERKGAGGIERVRESERESERESV